MRIVYHRVVIPRAYKARPGADKRRRGVQPAFYLFGAGPAKDAQKLARQRGIGISRAPYMDCA